MTIAPPAFPKAYSDNFDPTTPVPLSDASHRGGLRYQPPNRLVDITYLDENERPFWDQVKVPGTPTFEKIFSAFAQGTRLLADKGEIAVEDLMPGDRLMTSTGAAAKVLWIGSGNFHRMPAADLDWSLVRIMESTFGPGRPEVDVTLGPGARILQNGPGRPNSYGDTLMTPVHEFVDGVNVIEITPPTPVRVFHVVLDRHAAIKASGLMCETYHPGAASLRGLSTLQRQLFHAVFPFMKDLAYFGPLATPRAPDPVAEPSRLIG